MQTLNRTATQPSSALAPWVYHQHSLTDKLHALTQNTALQLIAQQWVKPTWWDKYFLLVQEDLVFQREIMMVANQVPYWYARTIIPKKCYDLDPVFFKRLEQESMRDLIFGETKVQRESMNFYPIDCQCIEYFWVQKHTNLPMPGQTWVRSCAYSFQGLATFYLTEVLLPTLEALHP